MFYTNYMLLKSLIKLPAKNTPKAPATPIGPKL
jgi:hypothetical protein